MSPSSGDLLLAIDTPVLERLSPLNMTDEAQRVLESFQEEMVVISRNVISHNWGWFSREDQRLHLQTVDEDFREGPKKVRVWLETKGHRSFEGVSGDISGPALKKLQAQVQVDRRLIEDTWIKVMIQNGWLKTQLNGRIVTLTAYPGTHNSFTREIDLNQEFPGAYTDNERSWDRIQVYTDFDPEHCALAVGSAKKMDDRNHIHLVNVLFLD